MGYNSLLTKISNIKSSISSAVSKDSLWSVMDVCNMLRVPPPDGLSTGSRFSMICTFDGLILKNCLFVQYDHYSDKQSIDAMELGATAILSSHQIQDFPCIIVSDVLEAVVELCSEMKRRLSVPSIAIAGSIGKTTTKYFINGIYKQQHKTYCNITNGNTFYYIGFELQRFDNKADVLIQEVSEDEIFGPSVSSKILKPEIAVITNMDMSHIAALGGKENIIKSISGVTDGMSDDGIVILNGDDHDSINTTFNCKVVTVAINNKHADYIASNIYSNSEKTTFDIAYEGKKTKVEFHAPGKHNVYCALQAFAAAIEDGISAEIAVSGIRKYRPLGYRQNIYHSRKYTIIADCYNANAKSTIAAIEMLSRYDSSKKKVAVLGEIAEIEGYEEDSYRQIANALQCADIKTVVTYGKETARINEYLDAEIVETYNTNTHNDLTNVIRCNCLEKGSVILFKGSRVNHLENVIKKSFPLTYIKGNLPVWIKYLDWTIKRL